MEGLTSPNDQMRNATTATPATLRYASRLLAAAAVFEPSKRHQDLCVSSQAGAWTIQIGWPRSDARPSASLQMRDGTLYLCGLEVRISWLLDGKVGGNAADGQ